MPPAAQPLAPVATVRAASADDAGEILTLQYAAWLGEGRLHESFELPPLTQTLDELRAELAVTTALVAVTGAGRIVGTVRSRAIDPHSWYVGRLGVVPDLHGHGIGSRLLDAIERLAPAGPTRAVLTTGPRSTGNIHFYARHGYTRIEPEPAIGPAWLVHLQKRLDPRPGGTA